MSKIPTPHISCNDPSLIAKTVLMPGDPLRAKYIADTYLTDVICFTSTRNILGYTGNYNGKKISVMGSGMGQPSIGIYSYELFNFYDVDCIVRIGSAGSYDEKLNVYDTVLVTDAFSESNYAKVAFNFRSKTMKSNSSINNKLRKAAGNKKNEIKPEDRKKIAHLYADFMENKNCKIYNNEEFLYKEYAVYQPLQRSYAITNERIEQMLMKGTLSSIYDEAKVLNFENQGVSISDKDKKTYEKMLEEKPKYDYILQTLEENKSSKKYNSPKPFIEYLVSILDLDKKLIEKIAHGLSEMDKSAEIQRDKYGEIIYDKESKDTEIVKFEEDINDYMAREVLPYLPDAKAFWEENLGAKKPVIKVGAEIPFTRYFYKYKEPEKSEELEKQFIEINNGLDIKIKNLFNN